jgi:hypothetical protein
MRGEKGCLFYTQRLSFSMQTGVKAPTILILSHELKIGPIAIRPRNAHEAVSPLFIVETSPHVTGSGGRPPLKNFPDLPIHGLTAPFPLS